MMFEIKVAEEKVDIYDIGDIYNIVDEECKEIIDQLDTPESLYEHFNDNWEKFSDIEEIEEYIKDKDKMVAEVFLGKNWEYYTREW